MARQVWQSGCDPWASGSKHDGDGSRKRGRRHGDGVFEQDPKQFINFESMEEFFAVAFSLLGSPERTAALGKMCCGNRGEEIDGGIKVAMFSLVNPCLVLLPGGMLAMALYLGGLRRIMEVGTLRNFVAMFSLVNPCLVLLPGGMLAMALFLGGLRRILVIGTLRNLVAMFSLVYPCLVLLPGGMLALALFLGGLRRIMEIGCGLPFVVL